MRYVFIFAHKYLILILFDSNIDKKQTYIQQATQLSETVQGFIRNTIGTVGDINAYNMGLFQGQVKNLVGLDMEIGTMLLLIFQMFSRRLALTLIGTLKPTKFLKQVDKFPKNQLLKFSYLFCPRSTVPCFSRKTCC